MEMSFVFILGVVLWLLLALWPAIWANKKGYSFWLIALLAWCTSFLAALIVVAFLKDKHQTSYDKTDKEAVEEALR